ncbi:nucleoside deaminase [Streptomyces sp. NPDC001663]|uniref:nucleoside deaminase n=1 Tax=Streptomyces sp. NPDC001663 TaxID=3364597 RepID=UPI0036CB94F0
MNEPLPAPWHLPFELAWEAFRAGSRPVGAVVVDAAGEVVATGRNRSQEPVAPPGQLAGTNIAHAEINALAQLPAWRRHDGHRLYTTLEPCLLCSSALIHSRVRHVVYAAPDPLWRGIEDVPLVGGLIAERWARREGPVDGPLATFGALLMQLWGVLHNPDEVDPTATRTVRRCLAAADGLLEAPTAQSAYDLLRPHL